MKEKKLRGKKNHSKKTTGMLQMMFSMTRNPTYEQKMGLVAKTQITPKQVDTWFFNARKRNKIGFNMVDGGGGDIKCDHKCQENSIQEEETASMVIYVEDSNIAYLGEIVDWNM